MAVGIGKHNNWSLTSALFYIVQHCFSLCSQSPVPVSWWGPTFPSMKGGLVVRWRLSWRWAKICSLQVNYSTLPLCCVPPFATCKFYCYDRRSLGESHGSYNILPCSVVSSFAVAGFCGRRLHCPWWHSGWRSPSLLRAV